MSDAASTPAPSLEELTRRVVEARANAADWDAYIADRRAEWEATFAIALSRQAMRRRDLRDAEDSLKAAIVAWYEASDRSTKRPLPGLGVRVSTTIDYDREMAFVWARRSGMALSLNERAFETLAATHAISDVEALCTFGERVTPTIAADLRPPPKRAVSAAEFAAIVGLPAEEHHELTPEVHRAS